MNKERQLRRLKISPDLNYVKVNYIEIRTHEAKGDNESVVKRPKFTGEGDYRPHKDLLNKLTMLRKYGLEMLGIELADAAKDLSKWSILELKLDGDHTTKKSRLRIVLGIQNEKTKKVSKIETQQVTLYPAQDDASKYHNADKVAQLVNDLIPEVWLYCEGKFEDEAKPNQQLALFNFGDMKIAS